MKFEYIELTGYIGLYQGTLKNNVKIQFGKNRITMIKGPNGSGKSTLLSAMNIYPDSNTCFIDKELAEKKIILNDDGNRYKIDIVHAVNEKGVRQTARAYIKKEENGSWIEYNPTGTISSYKEYIEAEFDLDPNFVALSFLSTEDKGLVGKTSAERKKAINSTIQNVEVYNNMLKVLNKRSAIYKSMLNKITEKIDLIGDEKQLEVDMNKNSELLNGLYTERGMIVDAIAASKAAINVIDPDASIQNLYSSIQVELERIKKDMETNLNNHQFLINSLHPDLKDRCNNLDETTKLYSDLKDKLKEAQIRKESLQSELTGYLTDREQEVRAIDIMAKRINSLESEFSYNSLMELIDQHRKNKKEYEKIFEDINIRNAINISKDEYITGLNTLNDIYDMIRAIESSSFKSDIELATTMMIANKNISNERDKQEAKVNDINQRIENIKSEIVSYQMLIEKIDILQMRPSNCKIDTCPFISESLEAQKREPEKKVKELDNILVELNKEYVIEKDLLESLNNAVQISVQLSIIMRNAQNNSSIINKLPVGGIFLDKTKLLEAIKNEYSFSEISELYKYINYANIFDEYKNTIDVLTKLEADLKIYQSKADTINELNEDLNKLNEKLNGIIQKITDTNLKIEALDEFIDGSSDKFTQLDRLLIIQSNLVQLQNEDKEYNKQLNTVSDNMEQIKGNLASIEANTNRLREIDGLIKPLEEDQQSLKYSKAMLKEYMIEQEEYSSSCAILEVLKKYTNPTKKGIQNLFIKVYMAQTLKLANRLLGLFFGGRLKLLPYVIDEGEFSIPCYSEFTGLTTDDVSHCSKSEKAMCDLALSGALMMQGSSKYNIFKIDEVDEGLDVSNRIALISAINTICDILNVEQFIMISHTSELEVNNTVDIIRLNNGGTELGDMSGNVICEI